MADGYRKQIKKEVEEDTDKFWTNYSENLKNYMKANFTDILDEIEQYINEILPDTQYNCTDDVQSLKRKLDRVHVKVNELSKKIY